MSARPPVRAVSARRIAALATGVLLSAALPGCAGLLRSGAPPSEIYVLRATAEFARAAAPLPASLQVGRPQAHPGLDSERIALVQPDRRMNYYQSSRWAAEAPEILEALVVQAMQTTGSWSAVQNSLSPFSSDYLLQITIRRFEADYAGGLENAPRVYVTLDCTLGDRNDRRVVASFTAEASAEASTNRLGAVVSAFETATNAALVQLTERTIEAVRQLPAASAR